MYINRRGTKNYLEIIHLSSLVLAKNFLHPNMNIYINIYKKATMTNSVHVHS